VNPSVSTPADTIPPHLTPTHPSGRTLKIQADQSRNEWFCRACGARVTHNPAANLEYGHRGDCPHRPESFQYARGGSR
jgi:hypothetical protein